MNRVDGGYLEPVGQHWIEVSKKERALKILLNILKGIGKVLNVILKLTEFSIYLAMIIYPLGIVVFLVIYFGPIYLMNEYLGIPLLTSLIIWTLIIIILVVTSIVITMREMIQERNRKDLMLARKREDERELMKRMDELEEKPMDFNKFISSWDFFDKEQKVRELSTSDQYLPKTASPAPETPEEYYQKRWRSL